MVDGEKCRDTVPQACVICRMDKVLMVPMDVHLRMVAGENPTPRYCRGSEHTFGNFRFRLVDYEVPISSNGASMGWRNPVFLGGRPQ